MSFSLFNTTCVFMRLLWHIQPIVTTRYLEQSADTKGPTLTVQAQWTMFLGTQTVWVSPSAPTILVYVISTMPIEIHWWNCLYDRINPTLFQSELYFISYCELSYRIVKGDTLFCTTLHRAGGKKWSSWTIMYWCRKLNNRKFKNQFSTLWSPVTIL